MRMQRALAALATVLVMMAIPAVANAATNFPIGPLNVSPTQGLAGSSFVASQDVDPRRFCPTWSITFAGVPEGADSNSSAPTRNVSGQVPLNAAPGSYDVLSFCGDPATGGQQQVGKATFIVIGDTTTTSTTSTTTTTIATTTTA
ncbi:MAG TPA: hypothetical protein VMK16_02345, partial [Acidimicrobiales bacterium]|nr:hypothetical protein [Acidimicrobiales bacterium]